MPELPEVETIKIALQSIILSEIVSVNVYCVRLRYPINTTQLKQQTKQILHIKRRGKYLLFYLHASGGILIHLGMSGYLRLVDINTSKLKHDHVEFILNNKQKLVYNDTRRFGCVLYTDDFNTHKLLQNLGIEPLQDNFNAMYLYSRLLMKNQNIKKCLMDSKLVVGVGNIYANEILFLAKISPLRIANNINFSECKSLVINIKLVLRKAINAGGTTLKDFQNVQGETGKFLQKLLIYGKYKENCILCQTQIVVLKISQRSSFYCPKCQV